ncbi:MAG: hypothetical protein Q7S83_03720 [bacterium]|nr:hypothetical protein [bacterium]
MVFSFNKKQVLSVVASVMVSVFAVTLMASAVSYISDTSVGVATATPGAAMGVKGGGIFEGLVSADYYTSTSTGSSWLLGALGIGTTTPGAAIRLGVKGNSDLAGTVVVADVLEASYLIATSTTATSTVGFGLTVDTTSLVVDAGSNGVGVATSTLATTAAALNVTLGVGAGTASSTVYVGGGPTVGAEIILRTNNGIDCVSISASSLDVDADNSIALIGRLIECPTE